jgi:hypothetical protein
MKSRSSSDSNAIIRCILSEGNRPMTFPPRLETFLTGMLASLGFVGHATPGGYCTCRVRKNIGQSHYL